MTAPGVVALRSRALRALAGRGAMLWVAEAADRVAGRAGPVGGPAAVGGGERPGRHGGGRGVSPALAELAAGDAAAGVRTRDVPASVAAHCAQVEAVREEVLQALAPVAPGPAAVPMISGMTG